MSVHLALMIESITSTYLAEDNNCLKETKEKKEQKSQERLFLYIRSFTQYSQAIIIIRRRRIIMITGATEKKENPCLIYVCTKK